MTVDGILINNCSVICNIFIINYPLSIIHFPSSVNRKLSSVNRYPSTINYSERKLSTGFAIAAFMASRLTVTRAIIKATTPASRKTHQLIGTRYA
jgi:hypothetical protein